MRSRREPSSRGGSGQARREWLEDFARIQRVTETVAEVVDAEHGEEDGRAREDGPVRREGEIVLGVEEDSSPRRKIWGECPAEEGQGGFGEDGRGHVQRAGHDD